MADGTVIVGVTGIVTSGVLGPYVAHKTQQTRARQDDRVTALDQAIGALTGTAGEAAWLETRAFGPKGGDWDERMKALLAQVYALRGHHFQLEMRFGEVPLTSAYLGAAETLREVAAILWDHSHGKFKTAEEVDGKLDEARVVYRKMYDDLLTEGRKFYVG